MKKNSQINYNYDFNNVNYEMLGKYSYDAKSELESRQDIIDRIANCDFSNPRENQDIINSIALWKINRRIEKNDELIRNIHSLSQKLKKYDDINKYLKEVKDVFSGLLQTIGISVAMASTILHMFMPEVFPIIDKRAYRVIYGKEMPKNITAEKYLEYVDKVAAFHRERCSKISFQEMDKVLYQIDIANGNTVD